MPCTPWCPLAAAKPFCAFRLGWGWWLLVGGRGWLVLGVAVWLFAVVLHHVSRVTCRCSSLFVVVLLSPSSLVFRGPWLRPTASQPGHQ